MIDYDHQEPDALTGKLVTIHYQLEPCSSERTYVDTVSKNLTLNQRVKHVLITYT